MTMLQAARSLALEWGYNGLGINMIAKTAGYDKQLFYRYFDDWEGLLRQLIPILCEGMDWERTLKPIPPAHNLSQRINQVIWQHIEATSADKTQWAMLRLEAKSPTLLATALAEHRLLAIKSAIGDFPLTEAPDFVDARLRLVLALTYALVQDMIEGTNLYGPIHDHDETDNGLKKSLNLMIEALFS